MLKEGDAIDVRLSQEVSQTFERSNTHGISVAHHGCGVWARGGELGQPPFRPGGEVAMLPEWILGLFLSLKLSKPISLPSSPELISTHSLCQLNVASDRNKHQISLCEKANYAGVKWC